MKFPPKKKTLSRERKPRERVHRKKDARIPKKVKKVKKPETPQLPPIAAPPSPTPTFYGEGSAFISLGSLSPLRLLRTESEHAKETEREAEITLMSNEDHRNGLPKSHNQVAETEEVISRFEKLRVDNKM